MKKLAALVLSLCLCASAYAQTFSNGGGSGSGGGQTPATGNVAVAVNVAAGNDTTCAANSGTCATLQKALSIANSFNYLNKYTLAITFTPGATCGTYTSTAANPIVLPQLLNYPAVQIPGGTYPSITGDTTTPTNCVINSTTQDAVVTASHAIWNLQGFQLKSTQGTLSDLNVISYSNVQINHLDFAGSGNLLTATDNSSVYAIGAALTSSTTSAKIAFNVTFHGNFINDTGTWTFNNSPTFSTAVANVIDHSILGSGTYVNGGTVTGPRFIANNYGLIEFSAANATFPGSTAGSVSAVSYLGDLTINLGVCDYNVSNATSWTCNSSVNIFTSANPVSTSFGVANTTAGGHNVNFLVPGAPTGAFGLGVGNGLFWDTISGFFIYKWDVNANVQFTGALQWSAQTAFTYNVADTSLSRIASGDSLALGNGTPGDFSGTLKLAHVTATALANSATTSAICYNTGTGVLTYDGTLGTCTVSDERLKNVGLRIDDALSKLLSINGFYYTFKDQDKYGHGPQIGVGAQTVEKVFPELVQTDAAGVKSVDYPKLAAPIIEAMRDLKSEADKMRACLSNWQCRLFGM